MAVLSAQIVLVTGAANGIGAAVSKACTGAGATVVAIDRDEEQLARLEGAAGIHPTICDVTDPQGVRRSIADAVARFGRLDGLVHCAGVIGHGERFSELTLEEWDRVMDVNLRGAFIVSRAVVDRLREQGRGGAIVHITSQLANLAAGSNAHYVTSKGALAQLVRAMAVELAPEGIRVNAVAPGIIETRMTAQRRHDDEWSRQRLARIPAGRFGTPDELGGATTFLLSDEARYVHGASLLVDGGYSAW